MRCELGLQKIFEKILKKLSRLNMTDSKLKVVNAFLLVAGRLKHVPLSKQMYHKSQTYLIWAMFIDRLRLGETRKTESELLPLSIRKGALEK